MMTVNLIINATTYNITNYVDINSVTISDAIDDTLGSGGFFIPFIKSNTIAYDMSKPLPRFSRITLEVDGITYYYLVAEDIVTMVRKTDLFSHKVTLIEPTKILQRRVIPDQTIRQPQGDLSDYEYVINPVDEDSFGLDDGILLNYTGYTNIPFDSGLSTDTSIINGMTLKQVRKYDIILNYVAINESSISRAEGQIEILVNGVVKKIDTFSIEQATESTPVSINRTMAITYTSSIVDEVVTIRAKQTFPTSIQIGVYIGDSSLKIQARIGTDVAKYTLDQVIDKLLASVKVYPLGDEDYEFSLADSTRARISTIVSPEFTWQGYTLYEALQECATYVAGQIYLGEDDFTSVHIFFYEDVKSEQGITYYEQEHHALSNDYVTALEINAQNVIKEDSSRMTIIEPNNYNYMTVRLNQDGFGQITDTTAAILLKQGIYRIEYLGVRGLEFTMYDGVTPITFTTSDVWNIKDFVVEQTKYSALPNTSSANSRGSTLDKGNTLYYVQGQNRILNLGYNDVLIPPAWFTPTALNYAVVEAILCQAQIENPTYTFGSLESENILDVSMFDLEFQVVYITYSQSRVSVYKQDIEGSESVMYFNEQAQLNDMMSLGTLAQKHVQRKGNQLSLYKGYTSDISGLLRLGQQNAYNEKLTRYTVELSPNIKTLAMEYTKDYANISSYRGVPSAYRQWEVPNNNLVTRYDKYTEVLHVGLTNLSYTGIIQVMGSIWYNFRLLDLGSNRLSYGRVSLDYDGLGYTTVVESSIDTQVYGHTMAITLKMYDNYSAGARLDLQGTIKYQRDTQYVDNNGRVKNVKYELYRTVSDQGLGNIYSDNYPSNNLTPTSTKLIQIEYNINKDGGEIMALTNEFVFQSNTDDITIFNGFAKYNGFIMSGLSVTARPFLLRSGYFPTTETINEKKLVSLGLLQWGTTISGNAHTTRITSPIGSYEGVIWIETKTFEPIFAIRTDAFDSTTGSTEYSKTIYIGG